MNHPIREQIIEKAIEDGAEFVTQPNGEKSVSTRDYRAAAQALMNFKPEPPKEVTESERKAAERRLVNSGEIVVNADDDEANKMKIEVGNIVEFNRERFMKKPAPAGRDYCDRHLIGKVTAIIGEHVNVEVFKNTISDEKDKYQVRKGEIVGICKES